MNFQVLFINHICHKEKTHAFYQLKVNELMALVLILNAVGRSVRDSDQTGHQKQHFRSLLQSTFSQNKCQCLYFFKPETFLNFSMKYLVLISHAMSNVNVVIIDKV